MTAITVSNKEWCILSAVRDALSAAEVDGAAVFQAVSVTTSDQQARETQLATSPVAVVRYVATAEDDSPQGLRGCTVCLEILVAARADSEAQRLEQALRLKNAAVNAVEAAPPPDARAWGDDNHYQKKLRWGRPQIDATEHSPWALARIPLDVGFLLSSGTAH
jgi:hypothetical protein